MKRKDIIGIAVLVLALAGGAISGCVFSSNGQVTPIEEMSELDFNKWKLYVALGTKIGANRLLAEDLVTEDDLDIAATVLETMRDQSVVPGATSFVMPILEEIGFTNDEVEILLLIVEQELLARGALDWIDPETGIVSWSPRTKELLTSVAKALRAATIVTDDELEEGAKLQDTFHGKMMQ